MFAQDSRLTASTFTCLLRSESPRRARIGPARRLTGHSRWSEWNRRRPAREEDKRGVTSADKRDKFTQQATALLRQPGLLADAEPPRRSDSGKKNNLLPSHLEYLGRLPATEAILDSKMRLRFF